MSSKQIFRLLRDAKLLAQEYYDLTKKPLGITGEIAEYEAAEILGVTLSDARQPGYDAVRTTPSGDQYLQIKGRRLTTSSKRGQRLGSINLEKEWDAVLLVLLDERYDPTAIFEADRKAIEVALTKPGSKARNERGQLSISQFRSIGNKIWPSG